MNPLATIPVELNWLGSAAWQAAVLAALVLVVHLLGRPNTPATIWPEPAIATFIESNSPRTARSTK